MHVSPSIVFHFLKIGRPVLTIPLSPDCPERHLSPPGERGLHRGGGPETDGGGGSSGSPGSQGQDGGHECHLGRHPGQVPPEAGHAGGCSQRGGALWVQGLPLSAEIAKSVVVDTYEQSIADTSGLFQAVLQSSFYYA